MSTPKGKKTGLPSIGGEGLLTPGLKVKPKDGPNVHDVSSNQGLHVHQDPALEESQEESMMAIMDKYRADQDGEDRYLPTPGSAQGAFRMNHSPMYIDDDGEMFPIWPVPKSVRIPLSALYV
jgi:hypothetical protein